MHSPLSILHEKLSTRSFKFAVNSHEKEMHAFDEEENIVIFFRWLSWFGQNLKCRFHKQIFLVFLCRMDKILQIHYEHERSIELLLNKRFLLFNPLADNYFIFHWNITLFLLKQKYHRTYYLNKCRMDV